MPDADGTILQLTANIVAAHVANNRVAAGDLPGLIRQTHAALAGVGAPEASAEPEHQPAVSVRKSLANPDRIVSMIDGKPYSSLKRQLGNHGLTPDQYRERYKLPANYPMVAPGYSEKRKALAVQLGLGRKAKTAEKETPALAEPEMAPSAREPKRRGRKPKAAAADPAPVEKKVRKPRAIKAVSPDEPIENVADQPIEAGPDAVTADQPERADRHG